MEIPKDLKAAFNLSDKKEEEEASITVGGKDLVDVDLEKVEHDIEEAQEKDGLDLQEKMEVEALDDKKGASNIGGTNAANQHRAEINQNYSGSIKKIARDKFAEKNKGFNKK